MRQEVRRSVGARECVPWIGFIAVLISLVLAPGASAGLVAAPKDGTVVSGPTRVDVKVGRGTVVARLNGERVRRRFLRTAAKRRSVRVGGAEGLRPGRNRLVVRRTTPRRTRVDRVRFEVRANGALAGISARGEHVAGSPLQLRARGKAARRWCLLSAPRGSDLSEARRCARPAGNRSSGSAAARGRAKDSGFAAGSARRTTFTPDIPGNYRIALTSGIGEQTTTDVYPVTASPSAPAVEFDIPMLDDIREFGMMKIQVGEESYPVAQEGNSGSISNYMLHIVVLDRRTLVPTSDTTYDCPDSSATLGCDVALAQELSADLGKLGDDSLVFVSSLDFIGNGDIGPQTLAALSSIGFDPKAPFPVRPAGQQFGVFAAIGIPGLPAGGAWVLREDALSRWTDDFSGVLVKDQFDEYRPAPTDYEALTVRSAGTTTENTMTIGDIDEATGSLPAGTDGGFQITVLDGSNGVVAESEVAVTNPASASTVGPALDAVNEAISEGDAGSVLIASLGSPADQATQMAGDWNALAAFVQQHGGTKHAIHAMKPGDTYAMAGRTGSGPAGGHEAGPSIDPAGPAADPAAAGSLVGALTRNDDDWSFGPSVAQVTDPGLEMEQALYQRPTPWPAFNSAAMTFIGNSPTVNLGPDLRQAYWVQPYSGAEWTQKQNAIRALEYPGGSPGFSAADFESLQAELVNEIGWLINAQSYLDSLASPFSDQGLANWQEVETIAGEIGNGVQPPNASIATPWPQIVDDLLSVAAAAEPELSIVEKSWKAGADIASAFQSGGSTGEDTFQTTANEFGTDLVARLTGLQSSYGRMLDVVAADYGKLETFGTLGGCVPGSSPACTPGWQWTSDMQAQASLGLQLWSRRQAFQALLPAKIGSLGWFGPFKPGEFTDAREWWCFSSNTLKPFDDLPGSAQAQLYSSMSSGGPMHDLWAIASWRDYTGGEPTLPKSSLTDPLFAPPDPGGDPYTGGLGLVPAHFFLQALPNPRDIWAAEGDAEQDDENQDCKFVD